jgi:hypothetical protein
MAEPYRLQVESRGSEIIVTADDFCAIYFKPNGRAHLVLKGRTATDDNELLAGAANNKARELGWID